MSILPEEKFRKTHDPLEPVVASAPNSVDDALRNSEAYFRQLTDTVPAIIWITRPDGRCVYLNQHWYDYTGQEAAEAEGFGWLQTIHPDHMAEAERIFIEANQARTSFTLLYRLRTSGGQYRWCKDIGSPKFNREGVFEGFIGTVVDVHEEKTAEQRLRKSEGFTRTALESSPDCVKMLDIEGRLIYMNYNGTCIMEVDDFSTIRNKQWWELWPESAKEEVKNAVIQALKGQTAQFQGFCPTAKGIARWWDVMVSPIAGTNGAITQLISVSRDITEKRKAEEALKDSEARFRQLSATLEEQVRQRTKELQRSNEDLQQFAHVASHDLKEPVRKIKSFINRLEAHLDGRLDATATHFLDRVHSAANRMSTMIDGVLTYSSLNAAAQQVQVVDLNEVMKNIEADLEVMVQQTGARFHYSQLPVIEGASVLLYQLFYNLVINAIKFAREGEAPVIKITSESVLYQGRGFTQIGLQDNGIGFDKKHAGQIFETFTRLHSKDQYEGTGLGLSLCRKIAVRHGGDIVATGIPGEGALFTVSLPTEQEKTSI